MNPYLYQLQNPENDMIDQEPYSLHETWETPLISEMPAGGSPSPVWKIGGKNWRIVIFPKGYKEEKNYLSIFLMSPKIQASHKVEFVIRTQGGSKTKSEQCSYTFSSAVPNRGFYQFIPINQLDQYTVNGKLVIDLSIEFNPPRSNHFNYRKLTGYVGLVNSGCTCYMNSVLQSLYHICSFRKIVYQLPTTGMEDITKCIPLALQHLFTFLQKSPIAPSTKELTTAFGWNSFELFMQHDVQEFLGQLLDNIEKKMAGTSEAEAIPHLFRGKLLNSIRALEFDYSSETTENFYDIHLCVAGMKTIEDSLQMYIQDDLLNGKNKYNFEGHGPSDCLKGYRFQELPPVLQIHLQRFSSDMYGNTRKENGRFEFPFELNMEPYLSDSADRNDCYVYELFGVLVHQGVQFGGHYYAYCRPTTERRWVRFNDDDVSIVAEQNAIDDNYGGFDKSHSAYFLVYIKKSEIERIMAPIDDNDIPRHCLDYFENWVNERSGLTNVNIRVITESIYQQALQSTGYIQSTLDSSIVVKPPSDIRFKDIFSNIKNDAKITTGASMWTIDMHGYPFKYINPDCKINQFFKSSARLFIAPYEFDFSESTAAQPRPFLVSFYNPTDPLCLMRLVKFVVLNSTSTLIPLMNEIKQQLGDNENTEYLTYHVKDFFEIKEIDPSSTLKSVSAVNGMIIFQRKEIPSHFIHDLDDRTTFRSFELSPEFMLKTVADFYKFNQTAFTYSFVRIDKQDDNDSAFKIMIQHDSSVFNLLKCVRKVLKLPETDSVLLFPKETSSGQPREKPLDFKVNVSIYQLTKTTTLFYSVLKGASQESLRNKISFKITVSNENLEEIATPIFLMPSKFQVDDVIGKIKSSKIVPFDQPLRIVQLTGSRIIKILEQDKNLESLLDYRYRAEIIPEDQIDAEPQQLIRVTLSGDPKLPKNKCVGTPFIFRIIAGEKFSETRDRLAKFTKVRKESTKYAYSNNCTLLKDFTMLTDDDVLSELIHGDQTMLYCFVPVKKAPTQNGFSWNRGVSIYN